MVETLALDLLPEGESAYVTSIENEPFMRRRLADLGLIRGTRITCLYHSPFGDPTSYLIRGAVIALRKHDAAQIRTKFSPIPVTAPAAASPA